MSIYAGCCYFGTIVTFVLYLVIKNRKRKYLFSCFNLSLYIYFFSIVISPLFYILDDTWLALGSHNASIYTNYLNKCIILNCIGLFVTIVTMLLFEFNGKYQKENIIYNLSYTLKDNVFGMFFWVVILLWYIVVLKYNKELPLFNGGRAFYLGLSISPIYLALNQIIVLYALYYGTQYVYKKKGLIPWISAIITLLFTGNRSNLVSVVAPIIILMIYTRERRKEFKSNKIKEISDKLSGRWKKRVAPRIFLLIFFIGLTGMILQAIRSDININIQGLVNEVFKGNTFSEIRDGAYILRGYEHKYGSQLLWGKTYAAGLMSFIPSGFSKFRIDWSFGRFTSMGLFGLSEHFGLRGGWGMEAFLNFGILGVIVFAIIQGLILAFLEKMFYRIFFLGNVKSNGKEYIALYIFVLLHSFFVCTSGTYNLYVVILFILGIAILSSKFNIKFKIK